MHVHFDFFYFLVCSFVWYLFLLYLTAKLMTSWTMDSVLSSSHLLQSLLYGLIRKHQSFTLLVLYLVYMFSFSPSVLFLHLQQTVCKTFGYQAVLIQVMLSTCNKKIGALKIFQDYLLRQTRCRAAYRNFCWHSLGWIVFELATWKFMFILN